MAKLEIDVPTIKFPEKTLEFLQRILGPFAEAGDFISEKIRFYRWKSSLETIRRAEEICMEHNVPISEVPLKTLVPLLEKASLEPEGSPMTETWATLLASATAISASVPPIYSEILSTLTHQEVAILDRMVLADHFEVDFEVSDLQRQARGINVGIWAASKVVREHFEEFVTDQVIVPWRASSDNTFDFDDAISEKMFVFQISLIESVSFFDVGRDGEETWLHTNEIASLDSIDVLLRNGLISRSNESFECFGFRTKFALVAPTVLGVKFVAACRGDLIKADKSETR